MGDETLAERIEGVVSYLATGIGQYEAEIEDLGGVGDELRLDASDREIFCFEVRGHFKQIARMLGVWEEVERKARLPKEAHAHILTMRRDHPEQREFIRKTLRNRREGQGED